MRRARSAGRWLPSRIRRRQGQATVAYLARPPGWGSVPARLVAAAGVVVVWLLFLSSAFWGGSPGRPLATEALLVVDPARGLRRALADDLRWAVAAGDARRRR